MTGPLRTPCCGTPFKALYRYEGRPHLQEKVVDGYWCLGEDCMNEWSEEGLPVDH